MTQIVVPIHLRWGDMDIYGHINNVAYAQYMEQSRVQLMAQEGMTPNNLEESHVVARNEIDYLAPLVYQAEPVQMHLWIERVGNATYTVGYELRNGETVHMRAKTNMVTFNQVTNTPCRIPTVLREYLLSIQAD
jgi:acyl-CoA thioester hydrolase